MSSINQTTCVAPIFCRFIAHCRLVVPKQRRLSEPVSCPWDTAGFESQSSLEGEIVCWMAILMSLRPFVKTERSTLDEYCMEGRDQVSSGYSRKPPTHDSWDKERPATRSPWILREQMRILAIRISFCFNKHSGGVLAVLNGWNYQPFLRQVGEDGVRLLVGKPTVEHGRPVAFGKAALGGLAPE